MTDGTTGEPIVDEISLECAADHEWIRQNKARLDACSRHEFQEAVSAADLSALFGAMVGDLSSGIRGGTPSVEQRRAERARERAHGRARSSAWKCRHCGGAVPHEAMKWYTLALKHASQDRGDEERTRHPIGCPRCGGPGALFSVEGGFACASCRDRMGSEVNLDRE